MRALLETENTELVHKLEECTRELERERVTSNKTKTNKVSSTAPGSKSTLFRWEH